MMMAEGGEELKGASATDRSEEEAEEFLPGFTSLEDYSKVIDNFIQIRSCILSSCRHHTATVSSVILTMYYTFLAGSAGSCDAGNQELQQPAC